eukprot:9503477-Pyramimonas_sp.AAC.2
MSHPPSAVVTEFTASTTSPSTLPLLNGEVAGDASRTGHRELSLSPETCVRKAELFSTLVMLAQPLRPRGAPGALAPPPARVRGLRVVVMHDTRLPWKVRDQGGCELYVTRDTRPP